MRWRDRLLLLLMRLLAPEGMVPQNVPMDVWFGTGKSTPEDPRLCMHLAVDSTKQPILSVVLPSDPGWVTEAYARLHKWADERKAA